MVSERLMPVLTGLWLPCHKHKCSSRWDKIICRSNTRAGNHSRACTEGSSGSRAISRALVSARASDQHEDPLRDLDCGLDDLELSRRLAADLYREFVGTSQRRATARHMRTATGPSRSPRAIFEAQPAGLGSHDANISIRPVISG